MKRRAKPLFLFYGCALAFAACTNSSLMLCGHDADGAAGYPANSGRWIGGMVHELGHAFGLPDATSDDGTCMSAALYNYPNCTFTQSQKDSMLNGPMASFLK
jgi:hypothetical protein